MHKIKIVMSINFFANFVESIKKQQLNHVNKMPFNKLKPINFKKNSVVNTCKLL